MTKPVLQQENVKLNVSLGGKEEAIREAGGVLVDNGYVQQKYIDSMLEREKVTSTFMGNGVAIPHGTEDSREWVDHSGLSVVQVPDGVDFDGNEVRILIGIAGKGDEHLNILSKIAIVCSDEDNIEKMVQASSKEELLDVIGEVELS
ncbi:PTS sugar transporter subunit IIA [uncultured Marinococcus sp.]|jgi:PTS system mannitol-specific IIA component|uniref:PTS sugar transporter subunit IIA n=1 Tax=uncultured Marinococcus sp. TaxID=487012 RepID=UPI00263319D5|nr:PTS sugar transporter subunit IIA [uncultured Marinococcus sp.]